MKMAISIVGNASSNRAKEDPGWGDLGPDPLRSDFSAKEFFCRLDQHSAKEIGEVLLDQKVIAGVGNILRSEILFRSRIHPKRRIDFFSKKEKTGLLYYIMKLFESWLRQRVERVHGFRSTERVAIPVPNVVLQLNSFARLEELRMPVRSVNSGLSFQKNFVL